MSVDWHVPQAACTQAANYANDLTEYAPTEFDERIVNGHALAAQNGVDLDTWCNHTKPCKSQCTRWAIASVQWLRDNGHLPNISI